MSNVVLVGQGRELVDTREDVWRHAVVRAVARMEQRLAFMSPDHHRLRNLVVRTLPGNRGRPLDIAKIARRFRMDYRRAEDLVHDLERHLFFLVRRNRRAISWAFPVTIEKTAHVLHLSSGEVVYGA